MTDDPTNIPDENAPVSEADLERLAIASQYLGLDRDDKVELGEILSRKRERIKQHLEFLRAFTDESRLEIVIFLMHVGQAGKMPQYSVSEIANRFNISLSTVSHHLQELKRVGVVRVERSGKERYYQADLDFMIDFLGSWHRSLLLKREMIRQGTQMCPADFLAKPDEE